MRSALQIERDAAAVKPVSFDLFCRSTSGVLQKKRQQTWSLKTRLGRCIEKEQRYRIESRLSHRVAP